MRTEDEFRKGTVKGSITLPLYLFRRKGPDLDSKRQYDVLFQTVIPSWGAAIL